MFSGFGNLFKHLCQCYQGEENLRKMDAIAKAIHDEGREEVTESLVGSGHLGSM
jgi:hypothetical protein